MTSGVPLTGRAATAPAVAVTVALTAVGLGYAVAQSLGLLPLTGGRGLTFDAYRNLLGGGAADDFWSSTGFTLWVAFASTVLAILGSLALVAWLGDAGTGSSRLSALLHLNLAIPHVVWAAGLLLVMSQSGLIARALAAAGLLTDPASMPVLVRDQTGIGIILHYTLKEMPFLSIVALALLRAQPRELDLMARTLGAHGVRRLRLYVFPTVAPGLAAAGALVFVFVVGAFEAPSALGASSPRMLSVMGVDLFASNDLADRPTAMALGVVMSLGAICTVAAATFVIARRWRR